MAFARAGVPLGVTFSFLVSAPMVNEVALVVLFGSLVWRVASLYMSAGLTIALITSVVIGRLNMERCLEDRVIELTSDKSTSGQISIEKETMTWQERIGFRLDAVNDIVLKVWPHVTIGIAVGAHIHGYVSGNFLAVFMAKEHSGNSPCCSPGVPMYSNASSVIPVVQALISNGAAFGTPVAFMMAVIPISTPERSF